MALTVLERAAKNILRLADDNLRRTHSRALREALQVNPGDDPSSIPSAEMISNDYNIDLEALIVTGICLDRFAAVEFLADLQREMTIDTFSKRYTARKYRGMFRRRVPVVGNKHVYTYGEILHLIKYEQRLTFPELLREFL